MELTKATSLSRFYQAGRYDAQGKFYLVEMGGFMAAWRTNRKGKLKPYTNTAMLFYHNDWQPISPKE